MHCVGVAERRFVRVLGQVINLLVSYIICNSEQDPNMVIGSSLIWLSWSSLATSHVIM